MKVKVIIPGLLMILLASAAMAQSVSFSYDNAGNRTGRTLDEEPSGLKSLAISDSLEIEKEPEVEELINGMTRIFPNPTKGKIRIEFYPEDENIYYLSVYSLQGYQLINKRIFEGTNELDISDYPYGTYVIKIFSNESTSKWLILKI